MSKTATKNCVRITDLENADLLIDAVYQGGRAGNASDEPLPALLGVSNQGGFRYLGTKEEPRLIVLLTNLSDPDWPDAIDRESGIFTYYGDNKKPSHELHDTPRFGNLLLRDMFEIAHDPERRQQVPPILIFARTGDYRDVEFLGLAVPGAEGLPMAEDLVAVWRISEGRRFQNYRAMFTILDLPKVSRSWLNVVTNGDSILIVAQ